MDQIERRKYSRVKISNSISYVGLDENGMVLEQNMGVVLDVSQSGILIESFQSVGSEYLSIMATNKNNSILEIKGKVAYCRKTESGKFKTGVMLQGSHDENIRFVKELIRAYHCQKM